MMTLSLFMIFLALLVVAIAFFHSTQGFFSALVSAILAAFSAVLALSYHEMIVEAFLGGLMADYAHAIVLPVLFAVIYYGLRYLFDTVVPGGVQVATALNKVGSILMGVVAGVFAAGIMAVAAQSLPLNPAVLGYSRIAIEPEFKARIPQPGNARNTEQPIYDRLVLKNPLHQAAPDERQTMFLPVDDILVETTRLLSDSGALAVSSESSLSRMHPDWLLELFGQRTGIQVGGRRTAMNKGDKPDVFAVGGTREPAHPDAGPYLLDRKFKQRLADFPSISSIAGFDKNKEFPATLAQGQVPIVLRVYFGGKAKDIGSLIRVSPASVRLVTQKVVGGEREWTNYFPVATLDPKVLDSDRANPQKYVYLHRADDCIFVDDSVGGEVQTPDGKTESISDKAIDFIFIIDSQGFLEGDPRINPAELGKALNAKISQGSFLEVKRMARVDLSGEALRPLKDLKETMAVAVMRKDLIRTPIKDAAAVVQATPEELARKLVGSWDVSGGENQMVATFETTNFSMSILGGDGKESGRIAGTWKSTGVKEGNLLINVKATRQPGGEAVDGEATLTIVSDDAITYAFKGQQLNLSRKQAGSPPVPTTPMPETPGTPTTPGTPGTPPPPPATPEDNVLKVNAPGEQSPKFYAAIGVPAGSTGDVNVAGGTVTLDGTNIKGLKLDGAEEEKLRGGGEPVNRLGKADGSAIWQVETTPGPGGWAFKDKLAQINAVDAQGNRYKVAGFWALADGKIYARFTADGQADAAGFTPPAAAPTKVYLAFQVPESVTALTKIMSGQAPLAGQ